MHITSTEIRSILTRTCGFLEQVTSHSLQPYRGCALGRSLCGVGCYVQHNWYITRGRAWGSFVEARANAAESYLQHYTSERAWARRHRGRFGIFLSSSTEPFQPLEQKLGITRSVLEAMIDRPPDLLILQSHSHHIADCIDLYEQLAKECDLRLHVSIETDRERLPGLPPPASSIANRFEAMKQLHDRGLRVIATVAPLLPMDDPEQFFHRLTKVADAVVIDHFIQGDGSPAGGRTLRTPLPQAMQQIDPTSITLEYRDRIAQIARRHFPARVGINIPGFAGVYQ